MHEFNAGCILLEKWLKDVPGLSVSRHSNHWVDDNAALDDADAVMIFSDGGGGHPALQNDHLERVEALTKRGVGLMMVHFAVEVPPDRGAKEFRRWIGGAYEHAYSCNPIWDADFKAFPEHPVTRGLQPFSLKDEWYFPMRFRPEMEGVTSLLVAKPSDETRDGPYVYPKGPYPHIQEAKGREETLMWCVERPDGGRGVGFTGGHYHANWKEPNFRKSILNALLWISGLEVPESGLASDVSDEEMAANLDPK